MTDSICSIGVVDSEGTEAGGRAIGASDHQESQGVWDSEKSEKKDKSELMQRLVATKAS